MDPTTYKRRRVRVLLAVGVTTAAIIWATTGNSKPDAETADTTTTTEFQSSLPPIEGEPDAPVYIEGPTTSIPTATNPIAYGSGYGQNRLAGFASFHRFSDDTNGKCHTEKVPLGIVITITNLNTGRQTTCFNVAYLPPPVGSIITLNTNNYLLIGELADAPLPVEITW